MGFILDRIKPTKQKIKPKTTIYTVGTNTYITQAQITYETYIKIAQSNQGNKAYQPINLYANLIPIPIKVI